MLILKCVVGVLRVHYVIFKVHCVFRMHCTFFKGALCFIVECIL